MLLLTVLFVFNMNAQEKMYILFEFMNVDNEQESAYAETEAFWQNIHKERVKNGDIIGWDLWKLQPGGEDQNHQYLTVNIYDDPVKMMSGAGDFKKALEQAYPDISEDVLTKIVDRTGKSRDLSVRLFAEYLDGTQPEYEMPLGTIASIDMMKVNMDSYAAYEKFESQIYKSIHQKQVNAGEKESWGLVRIMSPIGSDTHASHITVNMYKDYTQYFVKRTSNDFNDKQLKALKEGLELRDLKYVYMATLIAKVR